MRPGLVVHADWSVDARRRWMCRAHFVRGRWRVGAPEPVGPLATLFERMRALAGPSGAVFAGFDFPLGLPAAHARLIGIADFARVLPRLGRGRWSRFYDVAGTPKEVNPRRPFFPDRPDGTNRRQLVAALGLADTAELMRRCDHPTSTRPAAAPLFWTIGPKQVGKSAIIGWRDLLAPALRAGDQDLVLWPFTGAIEFAPGRVVVAESYPGEFYGHLGLRADRKRWSKRVSEDRAAKGQVLAAWARDAGVALDSDLVALLDRGFHTGVDGEDRFDATVGVLGMLNVVLGRRPPGDPDDRNVRRIEGWILGQTEG